MTPSQGPESSEPERILSAGLPPGYNAEELQAGASPAAVTYMRAYCAVVGGIYLVIGLFTVGSLVRSALTKGGGDVLTSAIFAMILGTAFGVMAALHLGVIAGGRRRWVHNLGIVAIIFDMAFVCCWLPGIPLLIVWLKPEVNAYYKE